MNNLVIKRESYVLGLGSYVSSVDYLPNSWCLES